MRTGIFILSAFLGLSSIPLLLPVSAECQSNARAWKDQSDNARRVGLDEWKAKNYDTAKIYLERARSQFPNDRALTEALTDTYIRLGEREIEKEPVEAVYWYEQALKVDPLSGAVWHALGDAEYRMQNWDEAVVKLLKAEELSKRKDLKVYRRRTRDALYMRGSQRVGYQDFRGARGDFEAALRRSPADPFVQLSFGYLEILVKRAEVALQRLAEATVQKSLHSQAEYYSGVAQQMLQRWVESLPHFRQAQTDTALTEVAEEGIARSQYEQASIHMRAGAFDQAEVRLVETTTLRPAWPEGWFYLGQSRLALEKGTDAKQAFLQVQAIDKAYPLLNRGLASADVLIGLQLQLENRHAEARDLFKEALAYDATRGDAAYFLGESHRKLETWVDAVNAFRLAQKLGAYHVEAGYAAGTVLYRKLSQLNEALAALEDVEQKSPNYLETRPMLVSLYATLGGDAWEARRWASAAKLLEKYFYYAPQGEPDLMLKLGTAYIEMKGWSRAIKWLSEGYGRDPASLAFAKHLAIAHVGLADEKYAAKSWQPAVSNYETARKLKYRDRRIELPLSESYRQLKKWSEAAAILRAIRDDKNAVVDRVAAMGILKLVLVEWAESELAANPSHSWQLADEALALDGNFDRALFVAGRAYLNEGKWRESIARLEKLYGLKQAYPGARQWLSDALFAGGQSETSAGKKRAAVKHYLRMIEIETNEVRAHHAAAKLYDEWQEDEAAIRHYERAVTDAEYHNGSTARLGEIHYRNGRWLKSLPYLDEIWQTKPELMDKDHYQKAIWQGAQVLIKQKQEAQYLSRLLQGVELMPESFDWNRRIGDALLLRKNFRKSYPYLDKAYRLKSEDVDTAVQWGRAASYLNEWELIVARLRRFQDRKEVVPILVEGLTHIAEINLKKNPAKSLALSKNIVELQEQHKLGHYIAGMALYGLERWEEGLEWFYKLRKISPDYAGLSDNLRKGHLAQTAVFLKGNWLDSAAEELEKSRKFGIDPDQLYLSSKIAMRRGYKEKAILELEKLIKQKPDWRDSSSLYNRMLLEVGNAAIDENDLAKATKYLQKYLDRVPGATEVHVKLAQFETEKGKAKLAVNRLESLPRTLKRNSNKVKHQLGVSQCAFGASLRDSKDWYNALQALDKGADILDDLDTEESRLLAGQCYYQRALIMAERNQFEDAAKEIEKALGYEGDNEKYKKLRNEYRAKAN